MNFLKNFFSNLFSIFDNRVKDSEKPYFFKLNNMWEVRDYVANLIVSKSGEHLFTSEFLYKYSWRTYTEANLLKMVINYSFKTRFETLLKETFDTLYIESSINYISFKDSTYKYITKMWVSGTLSWEEIIKIFNLKDEITKKLPVYLPNNYFL